MKQHVFSKGMMALATFVLVGGTACQEVEGDLVESDQEALEGEESPGRAGRGMKRGMRPGPRIMANLELTEEQEEAIEALRTQSRERDSATREQMVELRNQLQALWQVDQPDADAILAKHAEMNALHDTMREQRRALKQSIDGVLTNEQRAQLEEHRGDRPTKGRRGRGEGFGGRGGGHGTDGMGPMGGGFGRGGRGGGHGMGMPGMGPMGGRAFEQLELTEDQQAQIEALRNQAQEATSEARAELTEVREAMRTAHRSGEADESALEALDARADAARQVVLESSVRTRIAILGVLTAEQRAELQALRAERGEHRGMGRRHGRGFGRGHGGGAGGEGMGRGPGFGRGRGKAPGRGPGGGEFGGGFDGELAH